MFRGVWGRKPRGVTLPANHGSKLVVLGAVLACAAGMAWADLVVLRNGQELRGRVRTRGDQVRVELEVGGTVIVAKGDVERMEVDPSSRQVSAKEAAVSAALLKRLDRREAIHDRVDALSSKADAQRAEAERDLIAAGRAVLPGVRALLAGGTETERRHALRIVAAIGDPASLPAIHRILNDAKEQALHAAAADALADIAGRDAAPTLTGLLVNSKDDAVRATCLKRLAARREPFAAPFAAESLRNAALRPVALKAVSRWLDPVLLPFVLPLLDSASADTRKRAAAWVAALITPAHAVPLARLLEAYKDDKAVREALRDGLRRLHGDFPVAGDVALLSAPQAAVRNAAFESLKRQFSEIVTSRNEDRAKQPRFWQLQRETATAPRVLLVPIGSTTWLRVRELGKELERSLQPLKIPVEYGRKAVAEPAGKTADGRRLLAALAYRQLADPRSARVIGVVDGAVAMPGCDVALAPVEPGGPVAVSLAPLGEPKDRALRRARRLALHALARSFGVASAKSATCPSSALYEASELDAKSPAYDAETRNLLAPHWAVETLVAGFDYRGAARDLSRRGSAAKSMALRMQAAYLHERALDAAAAILEWRAVQQAEQRPEMAAVIDQRIALLKRADKWLARRLPPPKAPPAKRAPAKGR